MANHKRKKPKTYNFPTCIYCMFHGIDKPSKLSGNHLSNSTMGRRGHKDWRQPQMYDEDGRILNNG
jgi:hypothetical protein